MDIDIHGRTVDFGPYRWITTTSGLQTPMYPTGPRSDPTFDPFGSRTSVSLTGPVTHSDLRYRCPRPDFRPRYPRSDYRSRRPGRTTEPVRTSVPGDTDRTSELRRPTKTSEQRPPTDRKFRTSMTPTGSRPRSDLGPRRPTPTDHHLFRASDLYGPSGPVTPTLQSEPQPHLDLRVRYQWSDHKPLFPQNGHDLT